MSQPTIVSMNQTPVNTTSTSAFFFQAGVSFAISFGAVLIGVAYLPLDSWTRAFLALGTLYLVTSSFTLAKCVRDREEASRVVQRVDDARLERLLTEHDPLRPVM